ncbi:MAG: hypothetical protein KKF44_04320 [Nanoarchaeota archaeon]|nr:hypothetical protein [Nanoarchaeota archaeon]
MDYRKRSQLLLYYKRKDIAEAIVDCSKDREIGTRFGNKGFGKRPDILTYPNEILTLVKKGLSSFHMSQEKWEDPLQLRPGMKKRELDELRIGWDLIIDIDFPNWFFSKLTAHVLILALRDHKIKNISCKFSGNKGFHIGVPFSSFPETIGDVEVKNWFPEGPQKITQYLLDYVSKKYVLQNKEKIIFAGKYEFSLEELSEMLDIDINALTFDLRCIKCGRHRTEGEKTTYEYVCPKCSERDALQGTYTQKSEKTEIRQPGKECMRCGFLLKEFKHKMTKCECGSSEFEKTTNFNPFSVLQIDKVLISSRHMVRTPFSLHEKSGLSSIPIDPAKVMYFEKEMAEPDIVTVRKDLVFLGEEESLYGEAKDLVFIAMEYKVKTAKEDKERTRTNAFEDFEEAVPKELFPPCIKNILKGLEDGKKRSLFILVNFLTSVGWNYDGIEEELIIWNKANPEPLREVLLKGNVRYHRQKKSKVLPPNCRTYYQDLNVCEPDGLCQNIKNPVSYSRRKSGHLSKNWNNRVKLTENQKNMRREHREKLKKQKKT